MHRWNIALLQKRPPSSAAAVREQPKPSVHLNQHKEDYSNQSVKKQTYTMYLPPSFVLFSWLGSQSRELTFFNMQILVFLIFEDLAKWTISYALAGALHENF